MTTRLITTNPTGWTVLEFDHFAPDEEIIETLAGLGDPVDHIEIMGELFPQRFVVLATGVVLIAKEDEATKKTISLETRSPR